MNLCINCFKVLLSFILMISFGNLNSQTINKKVFDAPSKGFIRGVKVTENHILTFSYNVRYVYGSMKLLLLDSDSFNVLDSVSFEEFGRIQLFDQFEKPVLLITNNLREPFYMELREISVENDKIIFDHILSLDSGSIPKELREDIEGFYGGTYSLSLFEKDAGLIFTEALGSNLFSVDSNSTVKFDTLLDSRGTGVNGKVIKKDSFYYVFTPFSLMIFNDSFDRVDILGYIKYIDNQVAAFPWKDGYLVTGGNVQISSFNSTSSILYIKDDPLRIVDSLEFGNPSQINFGALPLINDDNSFYYASNRGENLLIRDPLPYAGVTLYSISSDFEINWEVDIFDPNISYQVYSSVYNLDSNIVFFGRERRKSEDYTPYPVIIEVTRDGMVLSSSIENFESSKCELYPNPASNIINCIIDSENQSSRFHLAVYNMKGECVLNAVKRNNNFSINTSELPNGKYIFNVQNDNRETLVKTFIVQH